MTIPSSALLGTPAAAVYICRSEEFVRRSLRYEVPVHQHGERAPLFFKRSDLDHWIASHTHVPAR